MLESGASESNRDIFPALIINTHCVQGPDGDMGKGELTVEAALGKPTIFRRDTT